MLTLLRKDVLVSILATAIVAAVLFLRDRYVVDEVAAHFSVFEVRLPTKSLGAQLSTSKTPPQPTGQLLRLFVRNNTTKSLDLRSIEVAGVKVFDGFTAELQPLGDRGDALTDSVAATMVGPGGVIKFITTGLSLNPDQQLALFIWANYYGKPSIEIQTALGTARATNAVLVVGAEKAFATYWGLLLLIIFLLSLAIYYFYRKSRIDHGTQEARP